MFQIPVEELEGKSIETILQDISVRELWETEKKATPTTINFKRSPDAVFPTEIELAHYDDQGVPKMLVAVLDITERVEMEKFKQQILSMVSHDLRTPLTSLRITTECMGDVLLSGNMEQVLSMINTQKTEDSTTDKAHFGPVGHGAH